MNGLWNWLTKPHEDDRTRIREETIITQAQNINRLVEELQKRHEEKEAKRGVARQNCNR